MNATHLDPEVRSKIIEECIEKTLEDASADCLYCIAYNLMQEKLFAMSDDELLAEGRWQLDFLACDPGLDSDCDCSGGCIKVDRLLDDPTLCDQGDSYVARSKSLVMLLSEAEGRT